MKVHEEQQLIFQLEVDKRWTLFVISFARSIFKKEWPNVVLEISMIYSLVSFRLGLLITEDETTN